MFDVKPTTTRNDRDCGAACTVSFLDYYDVEVTLDDMVRECHTGVHGCTAKDIIEVCRNHGITDVKAYKMDASEVIRQDRPSICWWCENHFIICCGKNEKGKVVICNPNRGRFGIEESFFEAFFSGVAIFKGEPHDL